MAAKERFIFGDRVLWHGCTGLRQPASQNKPTGFVCMVRGGICYLPCCC